MKLSNWSVVLATSIIVDSNSTSEDIGNLFPPTFVFQNNGQLENLGLGPQANQSGKIPRINIKIISSPSDLGDTSGPVSGWEGHQGQVGVGVTSWDLWGTSQPGVYHVSLSLSINWTQRGQGSHRGLPSLLRRVRQLCFNVSSQI